MQHYIYDASGERVLKAGSDFEGVYENGTLTSASSVSFNPYTTYPSAFMVIDGYGQYSKHYFAGSQRIVSRMGTGESTQFNCVTCKNTEQLTQLKQAQTTDLQHYMDLAKKGTVGFKTYATEDANKPTFNPCKGLTGIEFEKCCAQNPDACAGIDQNAPKIYYFHPDHLGTSTFLTDINGAAYQFFLNLPFGETMAEQKNIFQNFATPYKFTGKELDEETGLYYFGARYYDPKNSIWLGVDPLAEKMPNVSPYVYCMNNPIIMVDPDGKFPYPITIRSFHPSEGFGKGNMLTGLATLYTNFSGDNRSFSLLSNVTSRIQHTITADPQAGTVSYSGRGKNGTYSNASHSNSMLGTDTATPDGYIGNIKSGNNSVSFLTGYSGTNPLALGPTPDIDVDAKLSLTQKGNILNISGQVNGDNFPNTEAFIQDPSGQKIFLGADVRASGQDQNPTILFGPATENIMNINLTVKTNPKTGNFESVKVGDKWVTPAEYNKPILEQKP